MELFDASMIVNQFLSGLTRAGVLFLVASGLTLIFGVAYVINFSHGTLYMIGAFIGYSLMSFFFGGNVDQSFWLCLFLVPVIIAGIGLVSEIVVFRPVYGRPHIIQVLASFALILILFDIAHLGWGRTMLTLARPSQLAGAVPMLDMVFPTFNLFIIALALAVVAMLWFIFNRTRLGALIRAATSDREMTSALGVNVPWLLTLIFMLGSALAGLGGVVAIVSTGAHSGMWVDIIVQCFIVTVIGGMGSLPGALLGAFIIGQVHAFGILIVPEFALAFIFAVMAIVLIFRPWGFFGVRVYWG